MTDVLPRLISLTLKRLPIDDAAIGGVVESLDHSLIEELVLTDLVATDEVAPVFAGSFPRLRHLDLSNNHLTADGVRQLLSGALPALTHLDLSGGWGGSPHYARSDVQPIGDEGARAIADAGPKLTSLKVAVTGLSVDGLAELLTVEGLEKLDVTGNLVDSLPGGVAWQTLREVNLADCGLASVTVPPAPALVSMSLAYDDFTSVQALPQLWELNLHDHVLDDDALVLLELDLEQDCWNARRRSYVKPLPPSVVAAFPGLDAVFVGIVDEYHGCRYSTGFPDGAPDGARPELVAFLSQVEVERDDEDEDFPPRAKDFRSSRAQGHAESVAEAVEFARRMRTGGIGWPPER